MALNGRRALDGAVQVPATSQNSEDAPIAVRPRCRVLLAIPELDLAGPDRIFFELATRLDRRAFDVHVAVVTPSGYYLSQLPGDVTVHALGLKGRRMPDRYPVVRFTRLVTELRPHVVVATLRMIWPAGVAKVLAPRHALVSRVPVHFTAQVDEQARTERLKARAVRWCHRTALRRSTSIVSQSRAMTSDLASVGMDADTIVTIPNPIDPAWVARRVTEGTVELRGRPKLLAVGRLAVQKGFDVLLQALPAVRERFPDVHLTLVGTGPEIGALQGLAERCGVASAVTFAGSVTNSFPYYAAADLVVAPSRWEGLSNVVIEALTVGAPVVATSGPAAGQDLVTTHALGRLVEPGDAAALASAICDALSSTFDRDAISVSASQRFGAESVIDRYAEVILQAAGQVRPRSSHR